jgi:hypothetical protein
MARSEVAPLACSSVITGARSAARAAAASALASAPFWRAFAVSLAPARKPPGGDRCLGAIRDKGGLEFSYESHLLQHEAAGRALDLRQIRKANVHVDVEQHREKSDRAGEPVDLRHDNRDLAHASSRQSLRQRGTLAVAA